MQRHNPASETPKPCKESTSAGSKSKDLKHQYSLRNFTSKLKTIPRDKDFKPENDVVYHNQWTECNAMVHDEAHKLVRAQKTVEVSSDSHVDFRDAKIKKGRLHFSMKPSETGDISIFIKIDDFTVTKQFHVTCNPCSSSLSNMRIEKFNPLSNECVFRVYIFDVFGEAVHLNLSENDCELEACFQTGEDKVKNIEMHIENGQIYYDITVSGERSWSQDLVVLLNGKRVQHPEVFEMEDEECEAVDVLNDDDYDRISKLFNEDDSGLSIPLTTGIDDGKFVKYDENNCELQFESQNANSHQLVCKNVKKYDFFGAENAHIHNVKRVLKIKDYVEIKKTSNQANVIIDLSNVQSHLHSICKEVVQHLLRGLYYRKKASEAAKVRMEWKKKFTALGNVLSFRSKNSPSLELCKFFKNFFSDLMNKYNREACEELFHFFNFQRDESEVDLHGLLVADEKKLKLLRLDMLPGVLSSEKIDDLEISDDEIDHFIKHRQDSMLDEYSLNCSKISLNFRRRCEEVDAIICRFRLESDEAIRKLKETLESFDLEKAIKNKTPWLEIIVGAGRHSRRNEQNIRPKVEKLLKERNLGFTAVNKGALVVTFEIYSGPEPCFGEYYCKKCHRCWQSRKSYVGKYQKCSRCRIKCWPVKQREKERVKKDYRDGNGRHAKRRSRPHESRLCQKCQELGHPCN